MYLLMWYPIPMMLLFAGIPLIGARIGYREGIAKGITEKKDLIKRAWIGATIGIIFDVPLFCFILAGFSAQ